MLKVSGSVEFLFGDSRKPLRQPVSDAELVVPKTTSSLTVVPAMTSSDENRGQRVTQT